MGLSAIILAAGAGQRFGANKLKSRVGAEMLVERVFNVCLKYNFDEIITVTNDVEISEIAQEKGLKCVQNKNAHLGQATSICEGISAAKRDNDFMFFVGDQPYLTIETIKILARKHRENKDCVIVPIYGEKRGNPVIFPNHFRQKLLEIQGDKGGKSVLNKDDKIIYVEIDDEIQGVDVDTKGDYHKLLLRHSKAIIVRGGGDLATGIVQKLHRSGFNVAIFERAKPSAIRRTVCLCEAVYEGAANVEGVRAKLVSNLAEIRQCFKDGEVAVFVDETGESIDGIGAFAVVDATIAKRNLGTNRTMAPVTIGVGPGFFATVDVDIVVETMRGHNLGRLIFHGKACENTGIPGEIGGVSGKRVVHSSACGKFRGTKEIGAIVEEGEIIGKVNDTSIFASTSGVLRGIIRDEFEVTKGMKIADIDPRIGEKANILSISDKARAIGGAVLEAVLLQRNLKLNEEAKNE